MHIIKTTVTDDTDDNTKFKTYAASKKMPYKKLDILAGRISLGPGGRGFDYKIEDGFHLIYLANCWQVIEIFEDTNEFSLQYGFHQFDTIFWSDGSKILREWNMQPNNKKQLIAKTTFDTNGIQICEYNFSFAAECNLSFSNHTKLIHIGEETGRPFVQQYDIFNPTDPQGTWAVSTQYDEYNRPIYVDFPNVSYSITYSYYQNNQVKVLEYYTSIQRSEKSYETVKHRLDGPAEIYYDEDGQIQNEKWFIENEYFDVKNFLKKNGFTSMNEEAKLLLLLEHG